MLLVLEAPGGVDDERILGGRGGLLDPVEHDSGSVVAFLAGDHWRSDPLPPNLQLLDRRGPERITGGDEDAIVLLLQPVSELADGRRLARAFHADPEDH